MNKGISSEIRRILVEWNTISDVMDSIAMQGIKERSVMQMISRMKRNGEVVSREINLYGRTVRSYKISETKNE
jgi:hypothetical protein